MATWTPNEKQQSFLKVLKEADGKGLTLREASKIAGIEFKTGSLNILTKKGLVQTEDCEIACEVVIAGTTEVIGTCKKTFKVYKLAETTTTQGE